MNQASAGQTVGAVQVLIIDFLLHTFTLTLFPFTWKATPLWIMKLYIFTAILCKFGRMRQWDLIQDLSKQQIARAGLHQNRLFLFVLRSPLIILHAWLASCGPLSTLPPWLPAISRWESIWRAVMAIPFRQSGMVWFQWEAHRSHWAHLRPICNTCAASMRVESSCVLVQK